MRAGAITRWSVNGCSDPVPTLAAGHWMWCSVSMVESLLSDRAAGLNSDYSAYLHTQSMGRIKTLCNDMYGELDGPVRYRNALLFAVAGPKSGVMQYGLKQSFHEFTIPKDKGEGLWEE